MRCQLCSCEIPDNSTVCPNCGAPVSAANAQPQYDNNETYQQQYQQPYQQQYQQPGQQPYQPPYPQQPYAPYAAALTPLKTGWLIAAIVVSALTANTVSLVLSIIALVIANKYNDSLRNPNLRPSESDSRLVHNLGVASWVIALIGAALAVIGVIFFFLISLGIVSSGLGYELYDEFDNFLICASNLFM